MGPKQAPGTFRIASGSSKDGRDHLESSISKGLWESALNPPPHTPSEEEEGGSDSSHYQGDPGCIFEYHSLELPAPDSALHRCPTSGVHGSLCPRRPWLDPWIVSAWPRGAGSQLPSASSLKTLQGFLDAVVFFACWERISRAVLVIGGLFLPSASCGGGAI